MSEAGTWISCARRVTTAAAGERQVRRPDLDREGRDVVDQLTALAVVHESAGRAYRLERRSLGLGQVV